MPQSLEIIIGGKNDDSFGPTVLLGIGGTVAEAVDYISIRLPLVLIRTVSPVATELSAARFLIAGNHFAQHFERL